MIKIVEIFGNTIQGEGPYAGRPAVFLRMFGCSNKCSWCDTKYSWQDQDKGVELDEQQVAHMLDIHEQNLLVITGGEPFLQFEQANRVALSWRAKSIGRDVQWETSGKVWPQGMDDMDSDDVFICSPKFLHGEWQVDEHFYRCINPDATKFVMDTQEDGERIIRFIDDKGIMNDDCWVMPLGHTRDLQIKNMPMVIEFCVKHGLNFSPRLHVLAWDTKKGV